MKGIQIASSVQKLRRFWWTGGFYLVVELHRETSFRWECLKPEFSENLTKPMEKSRKILKKSTKNRSPVMPLIGKIAASSPAAQLEDSRVALGPAADLIHQTSPIPKE